MDTTPRPIPHVPAPAGGARDFVAVDDSGAFSYHESELKLIAAFEYVGEASCIIDRGGNSYDLALDPNRHLILGPEHGPAEFHWLRQALMDAREVHMEEHRLRRFYPDTPDQLLRDLFETLALEHGTEPATGPWTLDIDGITTRRHTLQDVDRRLSGQDQLENCPCPGSLRSHLPACQAPQTLVLAVRRRSHPLRRSPAARRQPPGPGRPRGRTGR